ncbi:ABC transporter substrate-binding protein [Rhabdaerophilum sp. SD176]|uniref:ABC transporter substrate-binding protein n=1 Tax=Rhabdaerophilum sp. SD176 TaxID=2983548 RepID=UPI0024DFF99D|nr:ABC transporter substrate-binding protein [Rhabdaerophilum sp. SD176]
MRTLFKPALMAVVLGCGWALPAAAQELKIAMSSEPSSADPHYHNLTPNNQIARHMYETLVFMDQYQAIGPGLASSWKIIDDTTWEFKLRANVKFHDGSPLTVDDVIFTFNRVPNVPKSPAPKTSYIRGKTIEKVDDLTFRVKTPKVEALMLNHLANIEIMSAKASANATTEDINAGKGAVGTGPYQFVEFVPGDRLVLKRNDAYWGNKEPWAKVTFRFIKSDPTRVAALLSGDVDVIETVPTADAQRLAKDPKVSVASALSNRLVYLHMDRYRAETPFVKGKDGSQIKNPFHDLKVRQAITKAINRPAIVERIMEGEAVPASQMLPDSYAGTSKKLKPVAYDVEGARKLLAEAGYPNGFKLTIHGPNGRYTNDTKIIEAVAQMLTRVGIEASVETLPPAVFFSRASSGGPDKQPEFSMIMAGWSAGTGEPSDSLRALLGTFDPKVGRGSANRGRYSNPAMDTVLDKALSTVDFDKRNVLLAEAAEIVMGDVGLIPIHYQKNTWAAKKGLKVTPRTDEYTLAMSVRP